MIEPLDPSDGRYRTLIDKINEIAGVVNTITEFIADEQVAAINAEESGAVDE